MKSDKDKIEKKLMHSALHRARFPPANSQHPCMKQLNQIQQQFVIVRANYGKVLALEKEINCELDIQELSACLEKLSGVEKPAKIPQQVSEASPSHARVTKRSSIRKKEKRLPLKGTRINDEEFQDERPFFNDLHPTQKVICVTKRPRA